MAMSSNATSGETEYYFLRNATDRLAPRSFFFSINRVKDSNGMKLPRRVIGFCSEKKRLGFWERLGCFRCENGFSNRVKLVFFLVEVFFSIWLGH